MWDRREAVKHAYLYKVCGSSRATSLAEANDIGGIVVDALDRDVVRAKCGIQSIDKGRADEVSEVRVFASTSCEDQRKRLADAVKNVVAGVVCSRWLDSNLVKKRPGQEILRQQALTIGITYAASHSHGELGG